jgi:hypothetical protein
MNQRFATTLLTSVVFGSALFGIASLTSQSGRADNEDDSNNSRIQQGFAIAPVTLNLDKKNRALVGLGSYLVNAVGGCNDCHTAPSYLKVPYNLGVARKEVNHAR